MLRVLNDDYVDPSMGFGTHPHANMEIVSIPLEGELEHRDSINNVSVIKAGDIQIMSAGTGVSHSEYNKSQSEPVKFLQIWVYPNEKNLIPSYDQMSLHAEDSLNKLQTIITPDGKNNSLKIHQNAWFHMGSFTEERQINYQMNQPGNGLYIFVLKGDLLAENQNLFQRDGFGIWDTNNVELNTKKDSRLLLIEVPMN